MSGFKPYPKYKESGIDWVGEVPEGWGVKKLKFTSEIIMGQSPDSDDCNLIEEGLPFLQGNAEFGSKNPVPQNWCINPNKISEKNDILVSVRAPIGAVNISNTRFGIGRGLCAIRTKFPSYSYFQFLTKNEELNSYGTGSTFKAISVGQLSNIYFVVPPLPEQQAIAIFLDRETRKLDILIQEQKELITLLQEKRQALISNAITKGLNPRAKMKDSGVEWLREVPEHWEVKPVKHVMRLLTDFTANGSFASLAENVTYLSEGFSRLIRLTDLRENLQNEGLFVDEKAHNYLRKSEIKSNDILMANVGAYTGFVCRVPKINFPATLGPNMYLLRFTENVTVEYITHILSSKEYFNLFQLKAQSAAQPKINKDDVKETKICIPPLPEQKAISQFLDKYVCQIDALIKEAEETIDLMHEHRASLISEAVTGKIDVRTQA